MDGSGAWPRVSPDGKPAVYATHDGGASWQRQDNGFPKDQAWWTVKRQAFAYDTLDPVGLYLGNTNGELWASDDEGASFRCLFRHLPHIYSAIAIARSRSRRASSGLPSSASARPRTDSGRHSSGLSVPPADSKPVIECFANSAASAHARSASASSARDARVIARNVEWLLSSL